MISNLSQITSSTVPKVREATTSATSTAASGHVQDASQASNSDTGTTTVVGDAQSGGTDQTLVEAIDKLNAKVQNLNRNLEFSLDKASGEVLVKVVDAHTHELVRQIPSEEALALAQNIDKYMLDHHLGLVQTKA